MDIDYFKIDSEHVWHPFTSLSDAAPPILVTEAKGLYLYSSDGRKIMDAVSSWWVNIHGHSNQEIAKAIYEQASTLEHVIFAGFTHKPAIHLAQNLLSVLPPNQNRIFFSDNGSTAVEVGIKMALQFHHNSGTPRRKIVALEGAYHGDTFGAMAVGERGPFTAAFKDLLFDVEFIPIPRAENITAVQHHLRSICEPGEIAAFIYEPLVQGAAGMVMYEAELLDRLLEICKNYGVLCIADEVFTGFGRTGRWFASGYLAHAPDIIAVSKGITGGSLPLGVTACTEDVASPFKSEDPQRTFFHGHSYTANPIACAAANASFALLSKAETWNRIRTIETLHEKFAREMQAHDKVLHARARGTILAIELRTPDGTSYFNLLKKKIYSYFLKKDILLRPLGNVIYVLPPYIITEKELETIYSAIRSFLDEDEF